jgi:hypothetical protein
MIDQIETERPPRGGLSEIRWLFDRAAAVAAAFFRFLRPANQPNTLRPVPKSGKARRVASRQLLQSADNLNFTSRLSDVYRKIT